MEKQKTNGSALLGSSTVSPADTVSLWLDHAALMTADLDKATSFYVKALGLRLRIVEDDPIREGRRRAMLFDSNGRDVLEIIEMTELAHRSVPGRGALHHLGFRFPRKDWPALRSRLDEMNHAYRQVEGRVFLRDADGLILEIEFF